LAILLHPINAALASRQQLAASFQMLSVISDNLLFIFND
jgi:hypothetical protein